MRNRRWFLAAAVALIATASALAMYAVRDADEQWQTFSDDASGVTVAHPARWEVQTVGRYCRRLGPGVLVSNVQGHTFRNVQILNGCTNRWDFTRLPAHHVVVDVSLFADPFRSDREEPETPLPLLLAGFQSAPDGYAFERVRRSGNDYSVRIWYGPSPSQEDQDAAARLVRSLDFRPLVSS